MSPWEDPPEGAQEGTLAPADICAAAADCAHAFHEAADDSEE
jgi:hypothetical protein